MSTDFKHTCFFTGHRIIPDKSRKEITQHVVNLCTKLINEDNVNTFIAGGALGFDTLAAIEVLKLKKIYPHIQLYLYIPCTDQTFRWKDRDVELYNKIKEMADDVKFISTTPYSSGCMQQRNRAMVNDAFYGIAYCTNTKSGTYSTVRYARDKGRDVIVIKQKESS